VGEPGLRVDRRSDGVVTLTLDRPHRKNAFDETLIGALTEHLDRLAVDGSVRALVITGSGTAFSAGGDLDLMRRATMLSQEENLAEARRIVAMLTALDRFPVPTIAKVNGTAVGGGVGLVAACDIAIAAAHAVFAISEVRIGLLPSVVAPFIRRAIGERACRRYFFTAERFDAVTAARLGLIHEVAEAADLDTAVDRILAELMRGGPEAMIHAKALLLALREADAAEAASLTTEAIAERRASAEGREGVRAFLEKRWPSWRTS
jgi:methylglutaconyl-CoA hydratase